MVKKARRVGRERKNGGGEVKNSRPFHCFSIQPLSVLPPHPLSQHRPQDRAHHPWFGAPDAVITGLDPNLTYLRLAAAADCVRAGARFIATNRDPVYPTERGLRPGAGSVAAALEATTGVTPLSIGKPAPHLLELAAEAVGREAGDAIMIGDGIGTDLAAARAVGARCVFMLTGVTTREELDALPSDEQPTAIAEDADALAAILDAMAVAT